MTTIPTAIAADLLRGVDQIAKEVGLSKRKAYHQLENKIIPAGKDGAIWIASRSALREHYARLTRGAA